MKKQRDEGDGRILLGDSTGGGAVMLWPIIFQCVGNPIGFHLDPSVCTGIIDDVCSQSRLALDSPRRNCYVT